MTMSPRSVVHLGSRLRLMMHQYHNSPFRIWRLNSSCVQRFMGSSPIVTRNSSSTNDTTYYDSQSGQHVAIHDESKIAVYLRGDYRTTSAPSSALTAAKELGMAGSIITLPQQTMTYQQKDINDGNNSSAAKFIESLSSAVDDSNKIFLHLQPTQYYDLVAAKHTATISIIKPKINLCFEYNNDGDYISSNIQSAMNKFDNGIIQTQTSIGLFNPTHLLDEDPITVAAQIASIIDTTSEQCGIGSISNILVAPIAGDEAYEFTKYDDELVQLCEELSYLDVPGSTIKSRLVVSALSSDQLEECLQMGITKYVIDYYSNNSDDGIDSVESRLNMLRGAVEENGKELVLNVR